MNFKNQTFNFLLILLGGGFLIYDLTGLNHNVFLKIIALAMLMFGLYSLTQKMISSERPDGKTFAGDENQ